jgi:hypothetical protein
MDIVSFIIQIVAIVIGLLAIGLFTKANLVIMKFRKLTQWGLLELWTGSINTQKLIVVGSPNNKVIEKELLNGILLHKRARIIGYVCLAVNILAIITRL